MRRPLLLAALGAALVAAAGSVALGPVLSPGANSLDPAFAIVLFAGLGFYWALGSAIVLRADGHVVGWLFAVAAAMLGAVFGCWATAAALAPSEDAVKLRAWLQLGGAVLFVPAMTLAVPAVAIVFPTGTLPGPRWRLPAGLLAGMVISASVSVLARPGPLDVGLANPVGDLLSPPEVMLALLDVLALIGILAIPVGLVIGAAAIVVRFRRSSGVQRAQLKWFLAATVPAAILIPLSLSELAPTLPGIDLISVATLPLAALAVAAAILRYRLFEIDRLVSRTIAYVVITAVLIAAYGGVILVIQGPLGAVTGGDTIPVAISTLIVAALFQPVRRRVQSLVDRRFDRARFDAARTSAAFGERLREDLDIESLTADLRATVHGALRPSRQGLWLRDGGR